ncbi:hypothetical protein [Bradyrhizobium sp.]|uniref:hypothetical protein n=1 Tax=Bradyrhizobium sp. TaxID=376 RepID=UPI003C6EE4F6
MSNRQVEVQMQQEAHVLLRWLMTEARKLVDPIAFLEALACELRAASVDVSRITTGVPILHPRMFSFSLLWELGKPATERSYRRDPALTAATSSSPIWIACQGGGPVRCDLTAPPREGEFAIRAELRRDGFTDYVVYAVPFADGSPQGALARHLTPRRIQRRRDWVVRGDAVRRSRSISKSRCCAAPRGRCSIPMSDRNPADGCSTARSGAAAARSSGR